MYKKVLDFVSYYNGIFDNKLQTQQPGDNHAFIQVRIVPVDIQCLKPASWDVCMFCMLSKSSSSDSLYMYVFMSLEFQAIKVIQPLEET